MRRRIAEDGRRAADLRGVSSQPLALLRACSRLGAMETHDDDFGVGHRLSAQGGRLHARARDKTRRGGPACTLSHPGRGGVDEAPSSSWAATRCIADDGRGMGRALAANPCRSASGRYSCRSAMVAGHGDPRAHDAGHTTIPNAQKKKWAP
jgi:hypothetical protein